MTTEFHIRYLKRQEIDTARWDACVARSVNSLIYGFHYYLDHMASGQWDALVLGDYEAIMPLTWRRKYGISYLYQPPFTQQTGIFATQPLSRDLIDAFLQNARQNFRFAEIFFNYGNAHPDFRPHANFILRLDSPYEKLAANYKNDLQRNLKQAARSPLHYSPGPDLTTALEGYRRQYAARTPHVSPADFRNFERLCHHLQDRVILRAITGSKGETLATALLLQDTQRLYLLQSTTPDAGRRKQANHYLVDQLIREWAGTGLLLDFEGSDLPGITHFYKNFGSLDQPYYFYRHNRLPWLVNLLKSLTN
jgi:hypothetical protein